MHRGIVTALLAVAEGADRSMFEAAFAAHPSVDIVGVSDTLGDSWKPFLEQQSDVVFVAYGHDTDAAATVVALSVRMRPDRPVVLVAYGSQNGLLRHAFEAGADDVVLLPQTPDSLRFALDKVLARRRGASVAGTSIAPLVTILGPKGGVGKTLVSANLAVALAQRGERVVLV